MDDLALLPKTVSVYGWLLDNLIISEHGLKIYGLKGLSKLSLHSVSFCIITTKIN
jgi:hypothetical protein